MCAFQRYAFIHDNLPVSYVHHPDDWEDRVSRLNWTGGIPNIPLEEVARNAAESRSWITVNGEFVADPMEILAISHPG